jgi:hypothetical protein
MAKNVQHFFMYLLVSCTTLKDCLFNSFAHLLIALLILLLFKFWSSLYSLNTLYPINSWQRFFSHPLGCLFILVIVSFDVQTFKILYDHFVSSCSDFLSSWSPIQKGIPYAYIFSGLP